MSSFNGEAIFDSGPHVFVVGPAGTRAVLDTNLGGTGPGYTLLGPHQATITVTGRLVGADVSALDDLLAAVAEQLTDPPTSADLIDNDGHTWEKVAFISFTRRGPAAKGRVVSQGYEAVFILLPD